jgi:hypothetical protein
MMFCPGQKCSHYSEATKYQRQCYYEPQCWKGHLDAIISTLGLRFGREKDTGADTGAGMSMSEKDKT